MVRIFKAISGVLLLCLLLAPAAFAAGKGKPKAPAHHETVIGSVSATSITIKEDKTTRTFAISPFTEITVNGAKAKAADLKEGMFVSVTLTDATRVSRIAATTK
jgi:hypothetical protein